MVEEDPDVGSARVAGESGESSAALAAKRDVVPEVPEKVDPLAKARAAKAAKRAEREALAAEQSGKDAGIQLLASDGEGVESVPTWPSDVPAPK